MAAPEARVEVHVYCQRCDVLLYVWAHRDVRAGVDAIYSVSDLLRAHDCEGAK